MTSIEYPPLQALDRLAGTRHIVVLYDDEEHRDQIVARYFQNGIEAGATCILHTTEDPDIYKARLAERGLDATALSSANRLHIVDPSAPEHRGKTRLATNRADVEEWSEGSERPLRIAAEATMGPDFGRDIEGHLHGEEITHSHFDELGMSLLCLYDLRKLEGPHKTDWVRGLIGSHHQVIYASDPRKAIAFDTDLLEETG